MAKFFNYFPKTIYSSNNEDTSLDVVTNIISRFAFESSLKENSAAFYKYQVKDSDTPEIIAHKFYGNVERHWIVLLFNDIVDPQWDWPLDDRSLMKYIDNKYSDSKYANTSNTLVSGLSWAKNENNIHSYYKVVTSTVGSDITIEKFEVDANTYANNIIMQNGTNTNHILQNGFTLNIKITKETKSYYNHEIELNESKREIKLLKPELVSVVEKEFKRIIGSS